MRRLPLPLSQPLLSAVSAGWPRSGSRRRRRRARCTAMSRSARSTCRSTPRAPSSPCQSGKATGSGRARRSPSSTPPPTRAPLDLATARRDAAKAQLDVLLAGTRPEEIDQARANLAAAQASLANAEATFERQKGLTASNASTKQLLDDARMALDAGRAKA